MKVVSVNIGEKRTIEWAGKKIDTGIFKYAVEGSIQLGNEDVVGDNVIERKYHGGVHKACYIYSADHYSYWKDLYPDLDFENGMFGENITIEGLDEANIHLGDIYQVGSAKVEVSQPREPCYKLGIRFNTQKILKQFINAPYPGVYLRVIEKGEVKAGDEMVQIKEGPAFANLKDVYYLLYQSKKSDQDKIETVLELTNLPPDLRRNLEKRLNLKKMTD